MFNSGLLAVAIDLAAIFLLLSIVCSTLNEWVAAAVAKRATTLEAGVATMLANPAFTRDVLENPLIRNLAGNLKKPSYIPSQSFSLSLISALLQQTPPPASAGAPAAAPQPTLPATMPNIAAGIGALPNGDLKRSLTALLDDARADYDKFRTNLEQWFDNEMDRVSGWYKRWSQAVLLVLAILIVVGGNVDAIRVGRLLWGDATLRNAIAAAATAAYTKPGASTADQLNGVAAGVESMSLPFGWCGDPVVATWCGGQPSANANNGLLGGWLLKLAGLALSIMAISMGAPVWFDVLGRIVNLRMAGTPPSGSS
jgi:hypothetical protein